MNYKVVDIVINFVTVLTIQYTRIGWTLELGIIIPSYFK